jgi:hypothetical protein
VAHFSGITYHQPELVNSETLFLCQKRNVNIRTARSPPPPSTLEVSGIYVGNFSGTDEK